MNAYWLWAFVLYFNSTLIMVNSQLPFNQEINNCDSNFQETRHFLLLTRVTLICRSCLPSRASPIRMNLRLPELIFCKILIIFLNYFSGSHPNTVMIRPDRNSSSTIFSIKLRWSILNTYPSKLNKKESFLLMFRQKSWWTWKTWK